MLLKVNGDSYETVKGTLSELLHELKVEPGRVAVEVNLKVIKRADFGTVELNEGYIVEIGYCVGGG